MTKQYLMPASRITTGTAVPTSSGSAGDLYVKTPTVIPSGYVQISTPAELVAFATRVNAGETSLNACLTADINMAGISYTAMGSSYSKPYSGIFDGRGHTISNLSCNYGIFYYVSGSSTISNIVCDGFNISGTNSSAGGLACMCYSNTTIHNCCVKNSTISATYYSGGLIAGCMGGDRVAVEYCYGYNNTISGNNAGGIAGNCSSSSIIFSNCAVYGGTHGHVICPSSSAGIRNCYTSASSRVTEAVFKTQGFWDGTGVSGTIYLSWDFDCIWKWDSTNQLPTLIIDEISIDTSLYAYNGSAWALQNTVLDSTPTSASTNGVTSGGVYTSLANKQKTITVSTSEPTSSEGENGDIWMVYTA